MKNNIIYDVLNYKRYCMNQMKKNIKPINVGSTALHQTKLCLDENSDRNNTLVIYIVNWQTKKRVIDI